MGSRQSRTNRNSQPVLDAYISNNDVQLAMEASLQDAPLPFGWEKAYDPKGNMYYIDHANKATTFDDPRTTPSPDSGKRNKKLKLPRYKDDFYSKVQHFRTKLVAQLHDEGTLTISVKRSDLVHDSYASISGLDATTLVRRLAIKFEGESGLDYGGMSREWFLELSEALFLDTNLKLFVQNDAHNYMINPEAGDDEETLTYYFFVGTVLGMAVYHGKMFYSYFVPTFYKSLLDIKMTFDDLASLDADIHRSMKQIAEMTDVESLDLTFVMYHKVGKEERMVELKEEGATIPVTEANKAEYATLCAEYYLNRNEKHMNAIKLGMRQFIPLELLSDFDPMELPELIGGHNDIDLQDMQANTDYQGFSETGKMSTWFWEVLREMSQEELAKFLHFVTGSTKGPIGGFAHLSGSSGPQKFTLNQVYREGLPTAHSCFNRLDMPNYKSKEELKNNLLYSVRETKGFDIE